MENDHTHNIGAYSLQRGSSYYCIIWKQSKAKSTKTQRDLVVLLVVGLVLCDLTAQGSMNIIWWRLTMFCLSQKQGAHACNVSRPPNWETDAGASHGVNKTTIWWYIIHSTNREHHHTHNQHHHRQQHQRHHHQHQHHRPYDNRDTDEHESDRSIEVIICKSSGNTLNLQ